MIQPTERIVLAAILALAALLRCTRLADGPPVGIMADEWRMAWQGVRVLRGEIVWPAADAAEPLGSWTMAAVFGVTGPSIPAARTVSAAAGVATVAAVWWAARPVLGAGPALFAALALSVLRWHILISRIAQPYALLALATIITLGSVARCRPGAAGWRWAAAGIVSALGPYAYLAGRALPVVTIAALGWGARRGPRPLIGPLVAALTAAVALAPLAAHFAASPAGITSRPGYLLAQLGYGGHPAAVAGRNLLDTGAALFWKGDGIVSSSWPEPPPGPAAIPLLLAGLAMVGIIAAVRTSVPGWNAFLIGSGMQAVLIAAVAGLGWPSGIHRLSFLAPIFALTAATGAARLAAAIPAGWPVLAGLLMLTEAPRLAAFVEPGRARIDPAACVAGNPQRALAQAAARALPGRPLRLHRQTGDPDSLHEMFAATAFFLNPGMLAGTVTDPRDADAWLWRTTEKRDLLRDLLPTATEFIATGTDAGGQTAGITIAVHPRPGDPSPAQLDPLAAGLYRSGELMGERRPAEALGELDRLIAGPGARIATLHAKRGFALMRLGRRAEALTAALRAVALGRDRNPTALNLAAFLLTTHLRDHARARDHWRRSLAADPDQSEVRANIGQMNVLLSAGRRPAPPH